MDQKSEPQNPTPSGQGDIGMNKGVVQPGSVRTENAADNGGIVISNSPNAHVVARPNRDVGKEVSFSVAVAVLAMGLMLVIFLVLALGRAG